MEDVALSEIVMVEVPEGVTIGGGGGVTEALLLLPPPPQPARAKAKQKIAVEKTPRKAR